MKKSLFILAVLALVIINQCSIATPDIDTKKEAGYISLSTSETKEVTPNIARISFAVENVGASAQIATKENNELSNKIMTALKSATNKDKDEIKTNNFSVRPVYATTNGKRVIKNYTAVNSITVQTKDIDKIAKLIDIAIENGANRTSGLTYNFENDKTPCNEIYPKLVKDTKEQADLIAKAAGTAIDGIKRMSVSCSMDSNNYHREMYFNSMADSAVSKVAGAGATVEAGKVKVTAYVNADFYVK